MRRALVAVVAIATVLSACGNSSEEDSRNVTIPGRDALVRLLPLGTTFAPGQTAAVAAAGADRSTCVIDHLAALWCWGRQNLPAYAGMVDVSNVPARMQIPGGASVSAVSAGSGGTSCAVAAGRVYCWGANNQRQAVPTSALAVLANPTQVDGLTGVADVVVADHSTCARKTDGTVWCWGTGAYYGLGQAAFDDRTIRGPIEVGRNLNATRITGADDTFCILTAAGTVSCWGRNFVGTTGTGTTNPVGAPTAVGFPDVVTDISMSTQHACAVLLSGAAMCWGKNNAYQVGNVPLNSLILGPNLVDLRGDRAMSVVTSSFASCVLTTLNAVKCWGMAPGTRNGWWTLVAIPQMTNVMMMSITANETLCAVLWTGEARCVGMDEDGSLGDGGANVASATAVRVGTFGTAGVPALSTTTTVAGTTTTTTSPASTTTTVVAVTTTTSTMVPVATTLSEGAGSKAVPGATMPTVVETTSSVPGGSAGEPTPPSMASPVGTIAPSSQGSDAVGAAVTVPQETGPGTVSRVLVIRKGRSVTDGTIARFAGVGVPKNSKITVTVQKASRKICTRNGAKVTGAKRGVCKLTLKVTPRGQLPRVRVVTAQVID